MRKTFLLLLSAIVSVSSLLAQGGRMTPQRSRTEASPQLRAATVDPGARTGIERSLTLQTKAPKSVLPMIQSGRRSPMMKTEVQAGLPRMIGTVIAS